MNNGIELDFSVMSHDLNETDEDLPLIIYIAGYCCYSVIKKLKCYCKDILVLYDLDDLPSAYDYLKSVDRGHLLYPSNISQTAVKQNLIIFNHLSQNSSFLNTMNKRNILVNLTLESLVSEEGVYDECLNGHSLLLIQ